MLSQVFDKRKYNLKFREKSSCVKSILCNVTIISLDFIKTVFFNEYPVKLRSVIQST